MAANQSFGPKRLHKIERALEAAWAAVENRIPTASKEQMKNQMAHAIIIAASNGETRLKALKAVGIAAAHLNWGIAEQKE